MKLAFTIGLGLNCLAPMMSQPTLASVSQSPPPAIPRLISSAASTRTSSAIAAPSPESCGTPSPTAACGADQLMQFIRICFETKSTTTSSRCFELQADPAANGMKPGTPLMRLTRTVDDSDPGFSSSKKATAARSVEINKKQYDSLVAKITDYQKWLSQQRAPNPQAGAVCHTRVSFSMSATKASSSTKTAAILNEFCRDALSPKADQAHARALIHSLESARHTR